MSLGGKISFPDGSVEINVPPRALSKQQTVYCCRTDTIGDSVPAPGHNVVFYSVALRLRAEDQKFGRKIHLKFRHFTEFENESQKKQLAAFVQQADSEYKRDPDADIEVDDEWVKLKVDHFCNIAIGAEDRVNEPHLQHRFLAMSFLTCEAFTRNVAVNLYLLIGPNDPAHMNVSIL
jgi:hypothetical protein